MKRTALTALPPALLLALAAFFPVGCASSGPRAGSRGEGPRLVELCREHKTDKCPAHHGYVEIYGTFFEPLRHRAERVLEIGVLHGESMRMWEAFFSRAEIFGIDIRDTSEHESERIRTFVADQAEREQLDRFLEAHGSGGFDIIIDDGGHSMEQQQVSFGHLFPHLRPGGIYVIEDIHTSFPERYRGYGVAKDESNSTFTMITDFLRRGSFRSKYLSEEELEYLSSRVAHCAYSYRPNKHHSDLFLCVKK